MDLVCHLHLSRLNCFPAIPIGNEHAGQGETADRRHLHWAKPPEAEATRVTDRCIPVCSTAVY